MSPYLKLRIFFLSEYLFTFLFVGIAASWFTYFVDATSSDISKFISMLGALYGIACSLPIIISYSLDKLITNQGRIFWAFLLQSVGFLILSVCKLQYITITLSVIIFGYALGRPILPILIHDTEPNNVSKNQYFLYSCANLAYATAPFLFGFLAPGQDQPIFLMASIATFLLAIITFRKEDLQRANYTKIYLQFFLICAAAICIIGLILKNELLLITYFCLIIISAFCSFFSLYLSASQNYKKNYNELLFMFAVFFIFFSAISQVFFLIPIYIEHNITVQIFTITLRTPWFLAINPILIIIWSIYWGKRTIKLHYYDSLLYVFAGFISLFFSAFTLSHFSALLIGLSYALFTFSELKVIPTLIAKISSWEDADSRNKLMAVFYLLMALSKITAAMIARSVTKVININHKISFALVFVLLAFTTLVLQVGLLYWNNRKKVVGFCSLKQ